MGVINEIIDFNREAGMLRRELEVAQTEECLLIAQAVDVSASLGDWQAVQELLSRSAGAVPRRHFQVVAQDGTLLANSQEAPAEQARSLENAQTLLASPQVTWLRPDQLLRVTVPLETSAGQPVLLIYDVDKSPVFSTFYQQRIQQRFWYLLSLIALGTFLLISWQMVVYPLNQIMRLARAITLRTGRVRSEKTPEFLLRGVNQAFDEMIKQLANQQTALEETIAAQANALIENRAEVQSHDILMHDLIEQSERLSRTVTVDEVIATIGGGALALSKASRVAVFTKDANGKGISAWSHNLSPAFIEASLAFATQFLAARPDYRPEPIIIKDLEDLPENDELRPTSQDEVFRAVSAWPLIYEGRASAFVCCYYDQPAAWEQDELEVFEAFFRQAAISLENARLYEAEIAQRRLAEALRDIATTLNSTLELDEVLEGILNNLGRVVPHDAAGIMLLEGEMIHPVRWHGIPESSANAFQGWRYSYKSLRNRRIMVETAQAVVIPETVQNPHWVWTTGLEWVRSYAGAPICQRGEVTGFIDVMSATPGFFSPEIGAILQAFAGQAAVALENARLYKNVQQRMAETNALYRAIQPLFHSAEDIYALASRITKAVTEEFSSAHCSILLLDEPRTQLKLIAQHGSLHLSPPNLPMDGPGLTVQAVQTGRVIYSPDVTQEKNYVSGAAVSRSELAIPLHTSGEIIGVLNLESPEVNAFDERAQRLLASFAERAALGLENARLFTKVRENAEQMARLNEIAQRHAQEADTLRRATVAVTSTLELQSVLDSILEHLEQVIPHDSACIFLAESEQFMRVWAVKGILHSEEVLYQRFPRHDKLLREVEQNRQPVTLNDAQADPRFHGWGRMGLVHGWMGAPLIAGNEFVGCLTLDRLQHNLFQQEEVNLAQAFANQAAVAVQNARLYHAAQQRARELEALHTATTSLVTTLDLQKLLERILAAASSAVSTAQAATLHLLDENQQLQLSVQQGIDTDQASSPEWNAKNSPWSWVIREGRPLLINSDQYLPAGASPVAVSPSWKGHSLLIAPLTQENRPLGLISLISSEPDAFSEQEKHLLISFASTATAALHNAQLHSEVQYLAVTDPLTNVYNRRGFFQKAKHLIAQAEQANLPLAALMIDIDFFKRINDSHGHDAGDVVLRELADRCKSALNETDLICRYGGEEFAILLAESDIHRAQAAAFRLFNSITGQPMVTAAGPVPVTISMGVAAFCEECNTLDKLLKCADQALYMAKDAGRNQVWIKNGTNTAPGCQSLS